MNNRIAEDGLVPSCFVFRLLPRFYIICVDLTHKKESMDAIKIVQADINSIVALRRVVKDFTKDILPAAHRIHKFDKESLVYSASVFPEAVPDQST